MGGNLLIFDCQLFDFSLSVITKVVMLKLDYTYWF